MAKTWEPSSWPTQVRKRKPPHVTERLVLPPAEEWMQRAACVGRWPEWDSTIKGEGQAEREARQQRAARVCRTECEVLAECREWAQRSKSVGATGVVAGMVGTAQRGKAGYRFRQVA